MSGSSEPTDSHSDKRPYIDSLLCDRCTSGPFSFDKFQRALVSSSADLGYTYSVSWEDVDESADERGCRWCGLLSRYRPAAIAKGIADISLRAHLGSSVWDGEADAQNLPAVAASLPAREQIAKVRFRLEGRHSATHPSTLELFVDSILVGRFDIYANEGDPASEHVATEDALEQRAPSVDWALAVKFIEECGSHEFCEPPIISELPTRLIDCSNPDKPRLVLTAGLRGQYAALSYVWGSPQPYRLTTENIDEYIQDVPLERLPQTIADAVFATHRLGLDYLWADALCILQDSEADKMVEISRMHGVYNFAYVTLIPEAAYSCHEGFLPERRKSVQLPFWVPSGRFGRMWVRHGLEAKRQSDSRWLQLRAQAGEASLASETIDLRPAIYSRAWCFQELMLSPRALLFYYPEAHFRCRTVASKVAHGASFKTRQDEVGMRFLFPKTPHSVSLASDVRFGLQMLWGYLVHEYSERRLTLPRDKLVAIAAVAEAFHNAGAGEYVAGLWRPTLLEDLMWMNVAEDPNVGSRAFRIADEHEYLAPSWSWASSPMQVRLSTWNDGWIERENLDVSYMAEIIECSATPISHLNPFGAISGAVLTLRAKVAGVRYNVRRGYWEHDETIARRHLGMSADDQERYCLVVFLGMGERNNLIIGG